MRHRHFSFFRFHRDPVEDQDAAAEGHHGRHRGLHRGRGMRRHGRPFDHGELRLLMLHLIAETPQHGYELIKAIEARMGGTYSPSPGVIYPTLSMLEEMGLTHVEGEPGGRRSYTITEAGRAHLAANGPALAAMLARLPEGSDTGGRVGPPAPLVRAMENVKLALRLKLASGALEPAQIEALARVLDDAAHAIESVSPVEKSGASV